MTMLVTGTLLLPMAAPRHWWRRSSSQLPLLLPAVLTRIIDRMISLPLLSPHDCTLNKRTEERRCQRHHTLRL